MKSPDLFISAETGEVLSVEAAMLVPVSFPRQLPKDVKEDQLIAEAQSAADSFQSLFFL